MSDKLDDAQSHNTDNEAQKTEDNIEKQALIRQMIENV